MCRTCCAGEVDIAESLLRIRETGGMPVLSGEANCAVYGMLQEAVQRGGAGKVPLAGALPWWPGCSPSAEPGPTCHAPALRTALIDW
jgi:hypothetical protein